MTTPLTRLQSSARPGWTVTDCGIRSPWKQTLDLDSDGELSVDGASLTAAQVGELAAQLMEVRRAMEDTTGRSQR